MSTQMDLLAIAENPHPLADDARDAIRAAIIRDARDHDGTVDPNRVRAALSNEHGLTVPSRMLSATYSAMAARGELRSLGFVGVNDDHRGGNAGKPQRHWLWIEGAA